MSKLYCSPVQVELDAGQLPKRFRWFGRWHRIFSCTLYEDKRHWWERLRYEEAARYRCETYQGLVCDLYFVSEPGTWVLERVWD